MLLSCSGDSARTIIALGRRSQPDLESAFQARPAAWTYERRKEIAMRMRHRLAVGLTVAVLGGIFPAAAAAPPDPGAMRHEAEQLMQQAEDLREQGRHDRAERLVERAEQLTVTAERREEMFGRMHELEREVEELHRLGRRDRAEQVERELDRLRERFEGQHRRERPEAEQVENRIRHLVEAAEHLEAAGLHDAADEVRGHAEELEQELRARQRPRPQQETADRVKKLTGALRQVQHEVEALREEVADLRQRVEELSRRR
jgi:chromosome segregation ATPase